MSGDQLIESELPAIFGDYAGDENCKHFLVVCRARSRRKNCTGLPANATCTWYFNIASVDDIRPIDRADMGIVLNQIEHMRRPDAMHLLSRMRDQFCYKVLARIDSGAFTDQELLALGYIRQERPHSDGHYYLFDPAVFFEKREWNTPQHWAHPENFTKRRW
ncbi:MAG: hypothetical protein KJO31_18855 [Gammaproteobacteria bacterium]|nr:hypothetical protein [Gammaproteobacteria bacterium]